MVDIASWRTLLGEPCMRTHTCRLEKPLQRERAQNCRGQSGLSLLSGKSCRLLMAPQPLS